MNTYVSMGMVPTTAEQWGIWVGIVCVIWGAIRNWWLA